MQDYSICNNARLISTQFLLQAIYPNKWCLKKGLLSKGLNPKPLSNDSSALTTRPQLLAHLNIIIIIFNIIFVFKHVITSYKLMNLLLYYMNIAQALCCVFTTI